MAEKATKNNKNIIIGICAAIIVIAIIIVAVVLATRGSGGLGDSYFTSDGTKYVITVNSEGAATEEEYYIPVKTHFIYYYSGDQITGLKAYYEYKDNEAAQKAFDYYKDAEEDAYADIATDSKYVILTANPSEYEELTASDVKQQIEFMESIKDMDLNNVETTETETVENTTVEE